MPRWFGSRSSSMAASASRSRTGGLYIGIILAVCGLVFLLVYEAIRATAQAALGVSHLEAAVIAVAAIAVVTCAMGLLAARALSRATLRMLKEHTASPGRPLSQRPPEPSCRGASGCRWRPFGSGSAGIQRRPSRTRSRRGPRSN